MPKKKYYRTIIQTEIEPLVELEDSKHSSGYDHLPHVRCVIQEEKLKEHFEEE